MPGLGGCTPAQFWQATADAAAGPNLAAIPAATSGAASARRKRRAIPRECHMDAPPLALRTGAPVRQALPILKVFLLA